MSNDTCAGTKANGDPCGAQPMEGSDYCRHHQPDPDDSEKVVEAEGKAVPAYNVEEMDILSIDGDREVSDDVEKWSDVSPLFCEQLAVAKLTGLADGARSESVQRKASSELLEYVKWKRERDDE